MAQLITARSPVTGSKTERVAPTGLKTARAALSGGGPVVPPLQGVLDIEDLSGLSNLAAVGVGSHWSTNQFTVGASDVQCYGIRAAFGVAVIADEIAVWDVAATTKVASLEGSFDVATSKEWYNFLFESAVTLEAGKTYAGGVLLLSKDLTRLTGTTPTAKDARVGLHANISRYTVTSASSGTMPGTTTSSFRGICDLLIPTA